MKNIIGHIFPFVIILFVTQARSEVVISSITIEKQIHERTPFLCKGDLSKDSESISVSELQNGLLCIPGDFNADGRKDYALFKKVESECALGSFDVSVFLSTNLNEFYISRINNLCGFEFYLSTDCSTQGHDGIHEVSGADTNWTYCFDSNKHIWESKGGMNKESGE